MKYYKVTVLKDLPGFHAGESYGSISEKVINDPYRYQIKRNDKDINELIDLSTSYPEFVKLELDKRCTVSTICPKCGGYDMFPSHKMTTKCDGGVRYNYSTVSLICFECETETEIYTYYTHSEVYRW